MLLLAGTGCQTLHPFAERTKSRIVSARSWANGGLEAMQSGHLQPAEVFFARAAEQHPTDFRNRANLARTHFRNAEIEKAIQEMEAVAVLSGNDPMILVELGRMYLGNGNLNAARKQAKLALREVRHFVPAYSLLGQVSSREGDHDRALAYLHKAARLDPSDLRIPMKLAWAYRANSEPRKALAVIDHLLSRHPIDSHPEQAILAKADLLAELDLVSTAITTLRQAMDEQQTTISVAVKLVDLQMEVGETSQARQTVARAREKFPNDVEDLRRMAAKVDYAKHIKLAGEHTYR